MGAENIGVASVNILHSTCLARVLYLLGLCAYVYLGYVCELQVVWNMEENRREPGIK